jgi:bifunctional non-homologous end joining protein LigD
MKVPSPAPLRQQKTPFDDPGWIYEIKHDGFRALAVIEQGTCRFVSRNKYPLSRFRALGEGLVKEVKAGTAILDGELAVVDDFGRTIFASMMKPGPQQVRYFAFDLLWLNGKDLRELPLLRRKKALKGILPPRAHAKHALYVDHVKGEGHWLYQCACELDLEGIVAKQSTSPYQDRPAADSWIKIKNPKYSQREGRGDLFKRTA